jgi:streptogramin lyase
LNRLDPESGHAVSFRHKPGDAGSLGSDDVRAIFEDSDRNLWVGTYIGGLNRLDRENSRFVRFQPDPSWSDSISGGNIWDIEEDRDGFLWIATNLNGLNRFDRTSGSFTQYRHDPDDPGSLSSDRVWTVHADQNGVIWAGTYGGGLNRLDAESRRFKHYRNDPRNRQSLGSDVVLAIAEDRNGTLWVGTQGGLSRLDDRGDTFTTYTMSDGLPNNVVNGILEDDNGNLWLSTNRGISKFNSKNRTFKNYLQGDGLPGDEFNPGACWKTAGGRLLFGGRRGLTLFDPEQIDDNPYVPPIALASLTQNGKAIPFAGIIDGMQQYLFDWNRNQFEFEFSALNFVLPQKNQYAYKLEGIDRDWYYSGNNRRGRYVGVPPGNHLLRLKGSNNDGVWNQKGLSLSVVVKQPPWKTQAAYAVYVLLAAGTVFALVLTAHIRSSRKKRKQERLERLVSVRTAELEELSREQQREIEVRQKTEHALRQALNQVKTLSGLLPICSYCKKIRDDKGYWNQIDAYISEHSDADISHGICPRCAAKYYPDLDLYDDEPDESGA